MVDPNASFEIAVPCEVCGDQRPHLVSELVEKREVTCPNCGASIDISSEHWRARIKDVSDEAPYLR